MSLPDLSSPQRQAWPGLVVMYFQNLRNWVNAFLVLIIPAVTGGGWNTLYFYVAGVFLLVLLAVFAYFQFKNFFFRVADGKFIINTGVLRKEETSVPFDRIQSVHIKQNIIQQILNVVALEIETAGSKQKEVGIPALPRAYAEDLKTYLLAKKVDLLPTDFDLSTEDLPQSLEEKRGKLLLHLSPIDLLKVGLTENHLRTGFIALAVLWSYVNQYQNFLEDDIDAVTKQAETAVNAMVYIIPIAVLVFVLLSVLLSLVRTVLRFYNLKTFLSDTGLTISSGLFRKHENVVPTHKIQYIAWKSNPLRKLIGYQSLAVYQAGSEEVRQKQAVQVPGCRESEIEQINEAFFPELLDDAEVSTIRPAAYWRIRLVMFYAVLPALAAAVAFWFVDKTLMFLPPVILLLSAFNALQLYKRFSLVVYKDILVIKKGFIFPKRIILKNMKVQGVELNQSIFQKKRGLVSLTLFTAAGDLHIPFIAEESGYNLANKLLYEVEKSNLAWM